MTCSKIHTHSRLLRSMNIFLQYGCVCRNVNIYTETSAQWTPLRRAGMHDLWVLWVFRKILIDVIFGNTISDRSQRIPTYLEIFFSWTQPLWLKNNISYLSHFPVSIFLYLNMPRNPSAVYFIFLLYIFINTYFMLHLTNTHARTISGLHTLAEFWAWKAKTKMKNSVHRPMSLCIRRPCYHFGNCIFVFVVVVTVAIAVVGAASIALCCSFCILCLFSKGLFW